MGSREARGSMDLGERDFGESFLRLQSRDEAASFSRCGFTLLAHSNELESGIRKEHRHAAPTAQTA
jgi:hypothetical protein